MGIKLQLYTYVYLTQKALLEQNRVKPKMCVNNSVRGEKEYGIYSTNEGGTRERNQMEPFVNV